MITRVFLFSFFLFTVLSLSYSCKKSYIPRPYGYYRVDLPEHKYRILDTLSLPYHFEYSDYAVIAPRQKENEKYWLDIQYPMLNASIHCSYKQIDNNLLELSEDARNFVYSAHSSQADAIGEPRFENPYEDVYAVLYDLRGNVASPIQFVVTDSVRHFFRGALYFDNVPNKDSIAPMLEYVREDIKYLLETFEWKK